MADFSMRNKRLEIQTVPLPENAKIRGRITFSLNKHDWADRTLDVKRLIKAIYRASPSGWSKMLTRITANMDGIDLQSIYKEVTESAPASDAAEP
jgi:hypothetical protein